MNLTPHDMATRGFLDAFGVEIAVRGQRPKAILEDDYQVGELGQIVRISSNAPVIKMASADVSSIGVVYDSTVTIGTQSYLVKEIQPDGFNEFTHLRLVEA